MHNSYWNSEIDIRFPDGYKLRIVPKNDLFPLSTQIYLFFTELIRFRMLTSL